MTVGLDDQLAVEELLVDATGTAADAVSGPEPSLVTPTEQTQEEESVPEQAAGGEAPATDEAAQGTPGAEEEIFEIAGIAEDTVPGGEDGGEVDETPSREEQIIQGKTMEFERDEARPPDEGVAAGEEQVTEVLGSVAAEPVDAEQVPVADVSESPFVATDRDAALGDQSESAVEVPDEPADAGVGDAAAPVEEAAPEGDTDMVFAADGEKIEQETPEPSAPVEPSIIAEAPTAALDQSDAEAALSDEDTRGVPLEPDTSAAQTETLDEVKPTAATPDPFAEYANEISQARTTEFSREYLDKFVEPETKKAAEDEEQAELKKQVSRARTVEFSQEDIQRLIVEATEAETRDEATVAEQAEPARPEGRVVEPDDVDDIFLDRTSAITLEDEEEAGEADTVVASPTEVFGDEGDSVRQDDTASVSTEELEAAQPEETAPEQSHEQAVAPEPEKEPQIQPATEDIGDTVVMDESDVVGPEKLVWEEESGEPQVELTVDRTIDDQPSGGTPTDEAIEDTVKMALPFLEGETEATTEPTSPAEEESPPAAPEAEPEERVADIPDHVLTPTLADIYFHQGQPRLAMKIYERLLRKDPDNERMKARLDEIKASLGSADEEAGEEHVGAEVQKPPRAAAKKRKRRGRARRTGPLAGVKISRKYREQHRRKKGRKRP
jgi:hypothetical protein